MVLVKKELWLRLNGYNFEDVVPPNLLHRVAELFGGVDASKKAFANKLKSKLGWEIEYALVAIAEYKKFVYLGIVSDFPATPSKVIDQVWHEHQLFNAAYRIFCHDVLGRNFDHYPELIPTDVQTDVFREQYLSTLELYRKEFGMEPPEEIWSTPKFKSKAAGGSNDKPRKKTDYSSSSDDGDMPLYLYFDGSVPSDAKDYHAVDIAGFTGFSGGESGGGGASADHDSGAHDDGGGGSCSSGSGDSGGGGGCSSGCGGGD